jgi:hypothetical protein
MMENAVTLEPRPVAERRSRLAIATLTLGIIGIIAWLLDLLFLYLFGPYQWENLLNIFDGVLFIIVLPGLLISPIGVIVATIIGGVGVRKPRKEPPIFGRGRLVAGLVFGIVGYVSPLTFLVFAIVERL